MKSIIRSATPAPLKALFRLFRARFGKRERIMADESRRQAMVARRTFFDAVGRFDPALRIGEDTDWFLRAADRGTVTEMVPDVLTFRRMHGSNMSRDQATVFDVLPRLFKASLDRRRRSAKASENGET